MRFVRFCLPQDFGTSITIARCRARDVASILAVVTGDAGPPRLRRGLGTPTLQRRRRPGRPGTPETAMSQERVRRIGSGRSRVTIQALEEKRHASSAQSNGGPRLPQGGAAMHSAIAPWSGQQCLGKDCRQYPGLRRTRASANTSGPDFTQARRPLVKLRSPFRRAAPNEESLFLLPDREERSDR